MKFVSNIISNKYLKQTRELYGDDLYLDFGSKLDNKISNDNHFDNNYKLNLELFLYNLMQHNILLIVECIFSHDFLIYILVELPYVLI